MGKSKTKLTVKPEERVAPKLLLKSSGTGASAVAIPLVPKTPQHEAVMAFKRAAEDCVNFPEKNLNLIALFDAAYIDGNPGCVSQMSYHHPTQNGCMLSLVELIYDLDNEALTLHVLKKIGMDGVTPLTYIINSPNAYNSLRALLIHLRDEEPSDIPAQRRVPSIISRLLAETLTRKVDLEKALGIILDVGVLPKKGQTLASNEEQSLMHLSQYAHMVLSPELAKRVMDTTGVDVKGDAKRQEDIILSIIDRPQFKHINIIERFIANTDLTAFFKSTNPDRVVIIGDFILKIIANFPSKIGAILFEKYPALYLHPIKINPDDAQHASVLSIVKSMTYHGDNKEDKAEGLACFTALIQTLMKNEDKSFISRVLNDKGMMNEPGGLEFAAQMGLSDFIAIYFGTGLIEKSTAIMAYIGALKHDKPSSANIILSLFRKHFQTEIYAAMTNDEITRAAVLSSLSKNKDTLSSVIAILDHIKPDPEANNEDEEAPETYALAFKSIVTSIGVQTKRHEKNIAYYINQLNGLLAKARQHPQAYEMLFMAIVISAREALIDERYQEIYEAALGILIKEKPNIRPETDFSLRAAHTLSMLYFEIIKNSRHQKDVAALLKFICMACPSGSLIKLIVGYGVRESESDPEIQSDDNSVRQFATREEYLKLAVQLILAEHNTPSSSLLAEAGLSNLGVAPLPPYRDALLEKSDDFYISLAKFELFYEIKLLHRAGVLHENAMPTLYVLMDSSTLPKLFNQALIDEMLQKPVENNAVFTGLLMKIVPSENPASETQEQKTANILFYLIEHPQYVNSLVKAVTLYQPRFNGNPRMADFLYAAVNKPNIQFIRKYGSQFKQDAIKTALSQALAQKQWEAAAGLLQLVTPEEATFDELLSTVAQSKHAGLITAFVEAIERSHNFLAIASTYAAIKEIDSHLGSLKNKQPEYAKPLRQLRNACADHFLQHVVDDFYPTEVSKTPWNKRLGTALMLMKKYPACQEIIAKKFKEVHNNEAGHKDLGKMHHAMMKKSQTHPLPAHQQKMHEALGRSTAVVKFSGPSHSAGAKPVENNAPSTSASKPSQPPSSQKQRRRRK